MPFWRFRVVKASNTPRHIAFLPETASFSDDESSCGMRQLEQSILDCAQFCFQRETPLVSFFLGKGTPRPRITEKAALMEAQVLTLPNNLTQPTEGSRRIYLAIGYSEKEILWQLLREPQTARISEEQISEHLRRNGWVEPDLVILCADRRELGEALTWSIAYSEIFFASFPLVGFPMDELAHVYQDYANRQRRFGGILA
jgi:undecaprenyl pyrophosphate synthase